MLKVTCGGPNCRNRCATGPGLRRPIVVVQGNPLNRSRISTVVCVPLTSNLDWADAPGNTVLPATVTGLPKDSVANASQIVALDRHTLAERVRRIGDRQLAIVMRGIDIVLGR